VGFWSGAARPHSSAARSRPATPRWRSSCGRRPPS
jgi:hypothetical protein